jgi:hypothetical protein
VQKIATVLGITVAMLALPVVILVGGPIGGWALGVILWLANWGIALATNGRAMASKSPSVAIGMSGLSFVARAWTVAIVLFVVALQYSETAALTAAGVFLAAFTADLVGRSLIFTTREQARERMLRDETSETETE